MKTLIQTLIAVASVGSMILVTAYNMLGPVVFDARLHQIMAQIVK